MRAANQSGRSRPYAISQVAFLAVIVTLTMLLTITCAAQRLSGMPPPSATSIGGHHFPFPPPSVTSIRPYGYGGNYRHGNGYYRYGRNYGYGYGYGAGQYVPYYIPFDAYGYGYDYVGGGPDMYSGPPVGPADPTLHIVVEQPPADSYRRSAEEVEQPEPPRHPAIQEQPSAASHEVAPGEPSVLIFRDGHQQEVTNYAIMGDSVYVFDKGRKKIALADLDVSATIKANDDRGLEFKIPAAPAKKKSSALPQSATPEQSVVPPASIAAMIP